MANDDDLYLVTDEDDDDVVLPDVSKYLLNHEAYTVLKWLGLIFCPALAWFIGMVGPEWGLEITNKVVNTINAFGMFIGLCIGASQLSSIGRD